MGVIRTAAAYLHQLQSLLPLGFAWPREEGTTLARFLDATSEEFARVDARIAQLVEEADPRTTSELLPDWERIAGLPDNCSGELRPTLAARRADLVTKLTATGGQSPPYFIGVARALGYEISIEEPRQFRVDESPVESPINDDAWHHTWFVNAPDVSVEYFAVDQSTVGDPLASWGNSALECRFNQLKPAHSVLIFRYGFEQVFLLLNDGSELLMNNGSPLQLNG